MADISSKVIIKDNNTIILTEDCKKDDYIDLSKVNKVDSSFINELINKEKDKEIKIKIDEAVSNQKAIAKAETESIRLDFNNKKQAEIYSLNQNHLHEISELKEKISKLEAEAKSIKENNENEKQLALNDVEKKHNNEITNLKQTIIKLQSEVETLKQNAENEKKLAVSEIETKYTKENADLKAKLIQSSSQKDAEIEKAKAEVKNQMQTKLDEVNTQLNKLQLNKSNLNVKQLGEQLETWCTREFESYKEAGAFKNCTWDKANDTLDKTKPDFYFKMYSSDEHTPENLVTSVCLEMKNESNIAGNKKKNSDHYAKLDEDRKKRNLKYAVLVSELEWSNENDIPVRKVNEYEDMYMVRPQYLVTFLTLVYSLGLKYVDLMNRIHKEDIKFEQSQKIIDEFNELKRKYFEDPIKSLVNKVTDMKKQVTTIKNSANTLEVMCDDIINNTFIDSQKKIEKFNITKIVNKISKLDD